MRAEDAGMTGPKVSRATDAMHLTWVRLRVGGATSVSIAAAYGVKSERVRVATNRILDADRAESGENINTSYWRAV